MFAYSFAIREIAMTVLCSAYFAAMQFFWSYVSILTSFLCVHPRWGDVWSSCFIHGSHIFHLFLAAHLTDDETPQSPCGTVWTSVCVCVHRDLFSWAEPKTRRNPCWPNKTKDTFHRLVPHKGASALCGPHVCLGPRRPSGKRSSEPGSAWKMHLVARRPSRLRGQRANATTITTASETELRNLMKS